MNCGNFETIVTELARDQIVEAHLREAALEHPRYCTVCANRFANEMALTAGLRALAAETAASAPSGKVETALLEALRIQTAAVNGSVKNVVAITEKPSRGWSGYAMAAAAIIVIALTSIIVIAIQAQRNHPGTKDLTNIYSPKPAGPNVSAPPISDRQQSAGKEDYNQSKNLTAGNRPTDKSFVPPHRLKNRPNRDIAEVNNPDPTEGFISLTQAADFMPLESGQIVKVEVPRAALLAIGLPVNAQRAGESIKAELLVGQDGIARAIRFLQ